jgi:hypothetical protein
MLAGLAAVAAPPVADLRDRARRLEHIERTLAQGNPVTLVGEVGMPEWFRWRTTNGPPTVFQAPDGALSLKSPRASALLELLPDPQQEHYRFRAEVRQESAHRGFGDIGVYFAGSNYSTAEEQRHFFASLTFDDNIRALETTPTGGVGTVDVLDSPLEHDPFVAASARIPERPVKIRPRKNYVQSKFHLLDEQKFPARTQWQLGDSGRPIGFMPAVFNKGRGPWHKLAVEVTPERFDFFWEDQFVNSLHRDEMIRKCKTWMKDPSNPAEAIPQLTPRDSLGLYVRFCEASFRRVVVEPIGNAN